MKKYLVTFKNTHDAIKGETIANKNKIKVKVMPTPTSITKSCGISLEFESDYLEKVEELIKSNEMAVNSMFEIVDREYILKEL